jgi:hypothetical protein
MTAADVIHVTSARSGLILALRPEYHTVVVAATRPRRHGRIIT